MAERKAHNISDRERTEDINTNEDVDFESLYLSDHVQQGLKKAGFVRPSPIQLAAIPLGCCGLDLVVQAKSGTGKTCVFTVVALEMVCVTAMTTQVLVVAPTREIAVQITQVVNAIGSGLPGLRAFAFIGGTPLAQDKAKLSVCHVAVATPGRLAQLVDLGHLKLDNIRLLVLDEADQLLAGQFCKSIVNLISCLPHNKQILAVSATYSEEVAKVAEKLMRSPNHVRLGKECPALLGVTQWARLLPYHFQPHRQQKAKMTELLTILSTVTFNQCLVFTNSQMRAESICNELMTTGWPVSYLSGGQAQRDRLQALDALCTYKCRILVSTDLSARGLDSEHVNLVINLDLPRDPATYLHRVGRAGRFGSRGCAITLAAEGEEWLALRAMVTLANVKMYLLQDGWDSNIARKDVQGMEAIETLNQYELESWQEMRSNQKSEEKTNNIDANTVGGSDSKVQDPGKNKKKKSKSRKHKVTEGTSKNKMNKEAKGQTKIDPMENAEKKKAENYGKVLSLISGLNTPVSSPSLPDIKLLVSSMYNEVCAEDNTPIKIPHYPNQITVTPDGIAALSACLEDINIEQNNKALDLNKAWELSDEDLAKGLQNLIEGKENEFLKQSNTDLCNGGEEIQNNIDIDDMNNEDCVSPKGEVSDEDSSITSYECDGQESINSSKPKSDTSRKGNRPALSNGKVNAERHKYRSKLENASNSKKPHQPLSHKKDKKNYPRDKENHKQYVNQHQYKWNGQNFNEYECHGYNNQNPDEYQEQKYYSTRSYYDDQYCSAEYGNYTVYHDQLSGANQHYPDNVDYNTSYHYQNHNTTGQQYNSSGYGYDPYVTRYLQCQQSFVASAKKFAAMMDYVQTMGKVSCWVARDYDKRMKEHANLDKAPRE